MLQLVIVMTANCWHGFVSPTHRLSRYPVSNRERPNTEAAQVQTGTLTQWARHHSIFFRTGLFIQGSFLLHLNADCTTALENTCFRVVGGVAFLSQFTRYTEAILQKDRKSTIACWRSVWTTTTNRTNLKRWCLMTCEWDSTIKYLSAELPSAPLNCSEPWWQLPLRASLVNWTQVNLTPNKLWETKGNSNKRTV